MSYTRYIDKSALVAEIKRLSDIISQGMFTDESKLGIEYFKERLLSFISTLEVKEVDSTDAFIEKAWDWVENNILSSNQQDKSLLYYEQFKKYLEL